MAKKQANKTEEKELKIPSTVFEVDGKKFKFRRPAFSAKIDGEIKRLTAVEALKDAEVLAHLVSIKSSVIEPVADKKGDDK
jgi:hypothetical protein